MSINGDMWNNIGQSLAIAGHPADHLALPNILFDKFLLFSCTHWPEARVIRMHILSDWLCTHLGSCLEIPTMVEMELRLGSGTEQHSDVAHSRTHHATKSAFVK
jgi:hypothetical protein